MFKIKQRVALFTDKKWPIRQKVKGELNDCLKRLRYLPLQPIKLSIHFDLSKIINEGKCKKLKFITLINKQNIDCQIILQEQKVIFVVFPLQSKIKNSKQRKACAPCNTSTRNHQQKNYHSLLNYYSIFITENQNKMSQVPTIDIVRFKMNSQSSIEDFESLGKYQSETYQQDSGQKQNKNIPLILKKMNSVQKYINDFKTTEMIQKQYRPKRQQSPLYDPALSNSKHLQKILAKTPESKLKLSDLKNLEEKCYVKYSSISAHDSDSKINAIENAQNQYIRLKHSLHTAGISEQPSLKSIVYQKSEKGTSLHQQRVSMIEQTNQVSFVNTKSKYLLHKRKIRQKQLPLETYRINHKDIQKQLKTSVIQEGGKKYFADLYLMKRERDKMLKEIFGSSQKIKTNFQNQGLQIGAQGFIKKNNSYRSTIMNQSLTLAMKQSKKFPKIKVNMTQLPMISYEQKMQISEQNFVQQKILKDRCEKKQKMLKGRNMNWNVYYEMLALKKNEKDKLKAYCKFTHTYGDD